MLVVGCGRTCCKHGTSVFRGGNAKEHSARRLEAAHTSWQMGGTYYQFHSVAAGLRPWQPAAWQFVPVGWVSWVYLISSCLTLASVLHQFVAESTPPQPEVRNLVDDVRGIEEFDVSPYPFHRSTSDWIVVKPSHLLGCTPRGLVGIACTELVSSGRWHQCDTSASASPSSLGRQR